MKRWITLLLTFVLTLGLAAPASAAKAKAAVMRLQLVEGTVSIRDAAGVPVSFQKDMRIYSGYTITTGEDGCAYILLDETKAVKLDKNTSVLVKKSGRKLKVKLIAGQLVFNVTAPLDSGENLEIRTSSMVVGVRGSSGVVSLREAVFVTGHGVVNCGSSSYALTGGTRFRPGSGISSAEVDTLPSVFLKEVRDNAQLRSSIREEGIYDEDELIAAIPAAEDREEKERAAARARQRTSHEKGSVKPAFAMEGTVPAEYTITWIGADGILRMDSVSEGEAPVYSGKTPVKEADAQYVYTFIGWTPELVPAQADAEYTAVFSAELRSYTVTWKDDKGKVIDTDTVPYGETPVYSGKSPTKKADAQYIYTFIGWTPELVPAQADAEDTAVFSTELRSYTVTWKDDKGKVIDTDTVPYGETPTHADPSKAGTEKVSYTFVGWDKAPSPVSGDVSYTAVFEAVYDFSAIIPQPTGSDNWSYQLFFPVEDDKPVTQAKAGELFTFYLGGITDCEIWLNGVLLGSENVHFSKEIDAIVCSFIVPEDPVVEIKPIWADTEAVSKTEKEG